jgi:hypothetical protein
LTGRPARKIAATRASTWGRQVLAQFPDLVPHQRAAAHRAHAHQLGAAFGELQHLQRAGVLDQAFDVPAHQLLGADRGVHRGGDREVFRLAQPRHAGGAGELALGDLAGDQVDLVAGGHGHEQARFVRARLRQHARMRGVADDRADVELLGQLAQALVVGVDHGDVVVLGGERRGDRGADLARAEDQDLHWGRSFVRPRGARRRE